MGLPVGAHVIESQPYRTYRWSWETNGNVPIVTCGCPCQHALCGYPEFCHGKNCRYERSGPAKLTKCGCCGVGYTADELAC